MSSNKATDPLAQDLVDGGALLHFALGHNFGPLLPHVEHEGVERLLDVGLPLLFLVMLGAGGGLPAGEQRRSQSASF